MVMPSLQRCRIFIAAHYSRKSFSPDQSYFSDDKKTDEPGIVLDTGASWSVTPKLKDFVSAIEKADTPELHSLDSTIPVHGVGWVEWDIEDMKGNVRKIRTRALYVPSAEIRLFSPQAYFMENSAGQLVCRHDTTILTMADEFELTFPYQPQSRLPIMLTKDYFIGKLHLTNCSLNVKDLQAEGATALPSILDQSNLNLTGSQKELLLWHQRLGHVSFQRLQALLRPPRNELGRQVLFPKNARATRCEIPRCEACQYAKQKRRMPPSKSQRSRMELEGGISDGVLQPGQRVSVDLYVAGINGRLPDTFGKEAEDKKYSGGAIFYDIASRFLFINHQTNLTAAMTVSSKHKFERFCEEFGVKPKEYLADNHPFRSAEFVQDCTNQGQNLRLSGVGAKHQNRVERSIQTITNWSRAMMLHFVLHWPQESRLDQPHSRYDCLF